MCSVNFVSVHVSRSIARDLAVCGTELGCGVRSRTAECFLCFRSQGLPHPRRGSEAGLGCLCFYMMLISEFIVSHVIICFLPCPWGFLSGYCILI